MAFPPPPEDPVVRLAMKHDPHLAILWEEYCAFQIQAGGSPSRPALGTQPFRLYALKRMEPYLPHMVEGQYATWRKAGASERATRVKEKAEIATRVQEWWGEAIDLLDEFLSVAEEFGMMHVHRLQAMGAETPLTFRVLNHLHARGVQVAEEVLALLRTGFAAGADARWRTLHETAVVAEFLARHGAETVQRYVDHDEVRVARAMEDEQEHHEVLGLEPYTDEEMREARERREELKRRYGAVFLRDYGWAAAALGRKPDGRPPTFLDIEASLKLEHSRAAYRSASESIHAGPGAVTDNPGMHEHATPPFVTRGTPFGLLEPGVRTAGTILLLSHALLSWRPFPFDRLALEAMGRMVGDVSLRFREAERRLAAAFPPGEE